MMLQTQLELERNIEKSKVSLSLKTDFNLIDAFRLFDPCGTGIASVEDIQKGLEEMGMSASDKELRLFMKRFDKDMDGQLRYSEFCDAFLPVDSFHASLLAKKAPLNMYPVKTIPLS